MVAKYFNSKYPIMEAAMTRVSDLNLALACRDAGIYPSLVLSDYIIDGVDPADRLEAVNLLLTEYVKSTGDGDVVFGAFPEELVDKKFIKIIKSLNISHLEISISNPVVQNSDQNKNNEIYRRVEKYLAPTKLLLRRRSVFSQIQNNGSAYCLKGSDAAGVSSSEFTTKELFIKQKELTPGARLIPYGGIGTPEQVAFYINNGAVAIAVGTLLAASKESNLSLATKQAMVSAKKEDLIRLPDTNQLALILGDEDTVKNNKLPEDWNREHSLQAGVNGTGGHIYVSQVVENITEIKSVKEIVEYLVRDVRPDSLFDSK